MKLNRRPYGFWNKKRSKALLEDVLRYVITDQSTITFGTYLVLRGYTEDILPDLVKKFPELTPTYKNIKTILKERTMTKAAYFKLQPNIAKFLLSANYGMVETTKTINENTNKEIKFNFTEDDNESTETNNNS